MCHLDPNGSLKESHPMLSYRNLVACLLEIVGQWGDTETIPNASIALSPCILPYLIFVSLQGSHRLLSIIQQHRDAILEYQEYFPSELIKARINGNKSKAGISKLKVLVLNSPGQDKKTLYLKL